MTSATLLFAQDWLRPENAHVHVHNETKNVSFIRYASLLKEMGVENHKWPLQLHNTELIDVDPHDIANLTREQMLMIRVECEKNPFYYFREIARAPGHSPENPKLFLANRGNMSMYWLFFNSITSYLIQIRQTGKSLSMDHLTEYLCNLYYKKKLVNLLTKGDDLRKQNMDRLREINQYLPFYLTGHRRGDINNTERIYYGMRGNRFVGHVPAVSDKFANLVGRGFTSPCYFIDEAAFLRYIETTLPAMLAGGNNARTDALNDGLFHGTVIATTAGKKDDPDGAYIYRLINEAATWSEAFLDANGRADLYDVIRAASPNRVAEVHCAFNHRQLGMTDEWLKKAMQDAKATGDAADRDYGNLWTDGGQRSPLTTKDTARVRQSEMIAYSERQAPWPFVMRWYLERDTIHDFMANNSTVMAFDASEAIGRDDTTIVIRNIRNGGVVAAANVNETNTIDIAKWIASLLIKYPNITWVPENKLNGSTIIDYVLLELVGNNIDPFKRIFNMVVNEHQEFKERYKTILTANKVPREFVTPYRKFFGFKTSGGNSIFSRDGLYGSVFMSAIKYTGDKVHDTVTIQQILGLVDKNGRIDHADGGKDDMVISWLLSYWFLTHAKNLSHYGINAREVLCENSVVEEENTPENLYERQQQQYLRDQAQDLIDKLIDERDPFIVTRYENKLRYLESKMCDDDKNTLAVDDLIIQIRQYRARAKRG